MKKISKNLLSKKVYRRVAQNYNLSKIKSKVTGRFQKLTIFFHIVKSNFPRVVLVSAMVISSLGYYPILNFLPIRQSTVLASVNIQEDQIVPISFPQPVVLPHPGYLSTRFSNFHPGIDIASGLGMPIHPITEGVVEEINYGFLGYGNHVKVTHANGFKSMYAHMGKVYVQKNQNVTSDDVLGEVGLTGYTTGPHTHLEVFYQGRHIDPLTILPTIPTMPQPSQNWLLSQLEFHFPHSVVF